MHPNQWPDPPNQSHNEEIPLQRGQALQRLAETADYVSQRAVQLDEQVQEAEQIVLHLGALARQLRTLSSNTTLEATRMRMSGPLTEIARQMRRISQQINESNEHLGQALRTYSVATGELRQAASGLIDETKAIPVDPLPAEPVAVTVRSSQQPSPVRSGPAEGGASYHTYLREEALDEG